MNNIRTAPATELNQSLTITTTCNAVGCGFKAQWDKKELRKYRFTFLAMAYAGGWNTTAPTG